MLASIEVSGNKFLIGFSFMFFQAEFWEGAKAALPSHGHAVPITNAYIQPYHAITVNWPA